MKPLVADTGSRARTSSRDVPLGDSDDRVNVFFANAFASNPEFFKQAGKFVFCFCGLQASYLTWGYMQELIMTTQFSATPMVPSGKFPSAAFCVFSNRFLAVIVAAVAVRVKHGSVFRNNAAPLWAFTPCALSNTMSSWSQYASLKYVSFPVQTVFKSSKIIPVCLVGPMVVSSILLISMDLIIFRPYAKVMLMGRFLKGSSYPLGQYFEALLITIGVAIFSVSSKSSNKDSETEVLGLVFLLMYISFDSFTSQWQDKIYGQYGRANVDPYQMMLGVNVSAIGFTTAGLVATGDLPVVWEFLMANPMVLRYNIITAITSATGQLFIFFTIREFGAVTLTVSNLDWVHLLLVEQWMTHMRRTT